MVTDLYNKHSRGFRGVLEVEAYGTPDQYKVLSPENCVREWATPITLAVVDVGDQPDQPEYFIKVARAPLNTANGFLLSFEDNYSTIATLTRAHPYVVGGGYSGCLYSVYHDGHSEFKCVHTPRPLTAKLDAYVEGIRAYARDRHWTLVHEVSTIKDAHSGPGINGCVTTFMATHVKYIINPRPMVFTVRLRQNAQGVSVGQYRVTTPTPP
jgi:hypothetical protein